MLYRARHYLGASNVLFGCCCVNYIPIFNLKIIYKHVIDKSDKGSVYKLDYQNQVKTGFVSQSKDLLCVRDLFPKEQKLVKTAKLKYNDRDGGYY